MLPAMLTLTAFGQRPDSNEVTCLKNKQIDFLLKRNVIANELAVDTSELRGISKALRFQLEIRRKQLQNDSIIQWDQSKQISMYDDKLNEEIKAKNKAIIRNGRRAKVIVAETTAIVILGILVFLFKH